MKSAVVVFAGLLILLGSTVAKADLAVLEFKCTFAIADHEPTQVVDCDHVNPLGPVYLWTRLRGGQKDLDALRAGTPIVIRYRWKRYVGTTPTIETMEAETEIGAGAIPSDVADALALEVKNRGYFDWRTWTENVEARRASYSVTVLDTAFINLPCADQSSSRECQVQVKVGR